MTDTTPQGQVPEALTLAEWLEFAATNADMGRRPQASDHRRRAAAELRRLHAQVAALTAAPAQPAPGVESNTAYAELPDAFTQLVRKTSWHSDCWEAAPAGAQLYGQLWADERKPVYTADHMHDFADRTHAIRVASHGQAPAGAAVREACSKIIHTLAAIVNLPQTDEQVFAELVSRNPLMQRVQEIKTQVDAIYKEFPVAPPAPTAQAAPAAEPDKADPRKLRLQSLVFSLARLSCVPPMAPALEHQLDRLIEFYFGNGDEKFARSLVLLKSNARSEGRRSRLVPSSPAAGAVAGPVGVMPDTLRSIIEGMSVSVDVSTGEHDAGHRYFGTVTEVMDCNGDKHGVTLLVQDAKPNFAPTPAAQADGGVVEDAARWRETLMHVGAVHHFGGQHFTLSTLPAPEGSVGFSANLLKGSVAQHFTKAIDAERAARAQQKEGL